MKRFAILAGITAALLSVLTIQSLGFQPRPAAPAPRPPAELLRLSLAAEKEGLAEPFKGVTAKGVIEPDLFRVRSTGVSTTAVRNAATVFLSRLTPAQRSAMRRLACCARG